MPKPRTKKRSAVGTKKPAKDHQKIKILGNQLRTELSAVTDRLKAERKKPETTTEGQKIIDLRLKLIGDLREDLRVLTFAHPVFCGCPNPKFSP